MSRADRANAVPAVEAATVVLVRDGAEGIEVCLLHRPPRMAFAPSAWVFPGGKVEEADQRFAEGLALDSHLADIAWRIDNETVRAGALAAAAVRETIEETGIVPGSHGPLVSVEYRQALESGDASLADVLGAVRSAAALSAVHIWSRWITPQSEARRFDTYFFVAVMPADGVTGIPNSEASELEWVPVARALEELLAGSRRLLPPTFTTLRQLTRHEDCAAALASAADRRITAGQVRVSRGTDGSMLIELPDGTTVGPNGQVMVGEQG